MRLGFRGCIWMERTLVKKKGDSMGRKYFPFYESFLDGAQELPNEQRLQFYDAIAKYALKDEQPHLTGLALMCWKFAKPNIDSFIQNYDSGKKGGRPQKTPVSPMVETPVSSLSETYKDKDKEKEQYIAPAAPRTDSGLAGLVQSYQQEIGEFPRSALDKLQRWREVYPDELIRRAFDEAAENGVRKWRYVDGILKGWQADGVRTLGDVETRREARKKPGQPPERQWEDLT